MPEQMRSDWQSTRLWAVASATENETWYASLITNVERMQVTERGPKSVNEHPTQAHALQLG